jgi:hypothetical protein
LLFHIDAYDYIKYIDGSLATAASLWRHKKTGEQVAIKEFRDVRRDAILVHLMRVIDPIVRWEHSAVLKFWGVSIGNPPYFPKIVTTYISGGSLKAAIEHRPDWWTATQKAIVAAGIVIGMMYIHANGISNLRMFCLMKDIGRGFAISESVKFWKATNS